MIAGINKQIKWELPTVSIITTFTICEYRSENIQRCTYQSEKLSTEMLNNPKFAIYTKHHSAFHLLLDMQWRIACLASYTHEWTFQH